MPGRRSDVPLVDFERRDTTNLSPPWRVPLSRQFLGVAWQNDGKDHELVQWNWITHQSHGAQWDYTPIVGFGTHECPLPDLLRCPMTAKVRL